MPLPARQLLFSYEHFKGGAGKCQPHLTIKDDHLYVVLEDDKREITLAKYKISLPEI